MTYIDFTKIDFSEISVLEILFFKRGTFSMGNQCKINDPDPTSENSVMVPKMSGRVMKLRVFGPAELLDTNFLMI